MEQRILQRIETVETRLLSAFHGWSTTMELRIKGLPVIDQRLAVIEDQRVQHTRTQDIWNAASK